MTIPEPPADGAGDQPYPTASPAQEAAVRALLADLPAEPMPADVVARLDARLAQLVRDEPVQVPSPGTATVVPFRRGTARPTPSRWRRLAPIAAAAAVVVGGGVLFAQTLGTSTGEGSSTSAGAGGGQPAVAPESQSGQPGLTTSGVAYQPATLATQVQGLLRGQVKGLDSANGGPTASQGADARTVTQERLTACVRSLSGDQTTRALAIDAGTWRDSPAWVVVLPGGTVYQVFVVRPACGPADLLYFAALSR